MFELKFPEGNNVPWSYRLFSKILIDDGCWAWIGWKKEDGYPAFTLNPDEQAVEGIRTIRPHRLLYELLVGPIPPGHEVDHLCYNRGCMNPDHLQAVTKIENLKRRQRLCRKGHRVEGENIKLMGEVRGRRFTRCKMCWEQKKGVS